MAARELPHVGEVSKRLWARAVQELVPVTEAAQEILRKVKAAPALPQLAEAH